MVRLEIAFPNQVADVLKALAMKDQPRELLFDRLKVLVERADEVKFSFVDDKDKIVKTITIY